MPQEQEKMKYKYHYYIVRQKGTNKYLRLHDSKYGTSFSLSDSIHPIDAHTDNTIESAKESIKFYIRNQKTLSVLDLEIIDLYVEAEIKDPSPEDSNYNERQFNEIELSCHGYGWIGEAKNKVTTELLTEKLYRDYRLKPKSFKWEFTSKEYTDRYGDHVSEYVKVYDMQFE